MLPFQIEVERDEERVENDGHRSIQKIQTKPAIPTFTNPEAMRIEENSNSALVAWVLDLCGFWVFDKRLLFSSFVQSILMLTY